jgi:hypothetical protein
MTHTLHMEAHGEQLVTGLTPVLEMVARDQVSSVILHVLRRDDQ